MRLRKTLATAAALLAATLVLAGCGASNSSSSSSTASTDQTAIYTSSSIAQSLDPAAMSDSPSTAFVSQVYDPLLKYDANTEKYVPYLATKWEQSADAKTFTFTLRSGVKFHDGSTLTAAGAAEVIQRMQKLGTGYAYLLANVTSIAATGPLTLVFTLNAPDVSFIGKMGQIYIPSAKALEANAGTDDGAKWFSSNEAGSGPYEMQSYTPNNQIVLKKFDDYWGGWKGSHISTWRIEIMDPTNQALNMRQGKITSADGISTTDLSQFEKNKDYSVMDAKGNPFYLTLNMQSPRLQDVNVRKAVAEAVPYDQIIKQVLLGHGTRLAGPTPEWMIGTNKSLKPVPTDLTDAKKLLATAGYTSSNPLTLNIVYCSCLDFEKTVATIAQANLAKIGVKVNVTGDTWPTLVAATGSDATRPDIGVVAMAAPTPDVGTLLTASFDPTNDGSWQYWGNKDASVVDLLKKGETATTADEQNSYYEQAEQKLYDLYASVWLVNYPFTMVTSSKLKNVNLDFAVTDFSFYQAHF